MPNFAPKIDVKVGSKIAQKSAKPLVFFGQPTFLLCSGGLEPAFRVLFSIVFHGVSQGSAIRVESGGKERKQNCSQL
jgi:hypothetical protein